MSEHEPCIGASDDWYTPPSFFEAFGITFALDPCSPGPGHWVPARKIYTKADDGLAQLWEGTVFMNSPFGGRHGHLPWLRKFFGHADGIAIVRAYTSSDWWHELVAPAAETLLFPRGKTQFVRGTEMRSVSRKGEVTIHPAGSIGTSPGHGIVLIGMGDLCNEALQGCGLGMFIDLRNRP